MKSHSINKVMIRVPNWVGDAVMAVPALRELRRIFRDARVTLVARPWVAGLFDGEALSDDVISVEDANGILDKATSFIKLARALRRERFDAAVLLQNAAGAALLSRAAGVRFIAGYPTDGRGALLHFRVAFEPNYKTLHQVRYYLNIAQELERNLTGETHIEIESLQPTLHASREAQERAWQIMESLGLRRRAPLLVINPGATNSRAKQWLPERFAAVADRIAEEYGFQSVIIGASGDREAAEEVARRMRSRVVSLAGKTSIAELKAVLSCSSLVISNDTGAAHVSAALDVATVVVFGPTEHACTRPLSNKAVVVRRPVECSPCMLRDCPIDHRCMTGVEADDVYLAAQSLLVRFIQS